MRLLACLLLCFPLVSLAAGGGAHLDRANIVPDDRQSLQRGARLFANYCLSCHSASYMRYNRLSESLGLTEAQIVENLMPAGGKIGSVMKVAMSAEDAREWFGTVPPDLSVISRSRGVDWLYTYLRSFYVDESRAMGVNNVVFPDVGMPNVLWDLQGTQKAIYAKHDGDHGVVLEGLEITEPGQLTPREFDRAIRDLVNFLAFMGEPAKQERISLGIKVLLFLFFFLLVAYFLKKEYWKDVH